MGTMIWSVILDYAMAFIRSNIIGSSKRTNLNVGLEKMIVYWLKSLLCRLHGQIPESSEK